MINISDISTDRWSMSITNFGEVVADVEDLKQCLYIIVSTRKGSAPGWRAFGCGLFDHLDKPVNVVGPLVVQEMRASIERWEPNIVIQDITFSHEDLGKVRWTIKWQPSDGTRTTDPISTSFELADGLFYLVDGFGRFLLSDLGVLTL